jgi:hypothetical protein
MNTYSGDARLDIENLAMPVLDRPIDPPTVQMLVRKQKHASGRRRSTSSSEEKRTLKRILSPSILWFGGQCMDIMQQKLEAIDDFDTVSSMGDGLALLVSI